MMPRGMLLFTAALGLPLATLGQTPKAVAVPRDPLELVTGVAETVDSPEAKEAAAKLMARARAFYAIRNAGAAFDLKVSFAVTSAGQTEFDGNWYGPSAAAGPPSQHFVFIIEKFFEPRQ